MSMEKSIYYGKEHRKPHYGSKVFDWSCRNHGACSYCYDNRMHSDRKRLLTVKEEIKDNNYLDNESETE